MNPPQYGQNLASSSIGRPHLGQGVSGGIRLLTFITPLEISPYPIPLPVPRRVLIPCFNFSAAKNGNAT
jgi:hypothetical protein